MISLGLFSGCSSSRPKPKKLWTQEQAHQQIIQAVDDPNADRRRVAVESLGKSKFVNSDPCQKALSVVVRTDHSRNVRISAARALGMSQTANAFDPLQQVLDSQKYPDEVLPATPDLESEVLLSMDRLLTSKVRPGNELLIQSIVIRVLVQSATQPVQVEAARVLRHFRTSAVLAALIETLKGSNFTLNYQVEQSLFELTGCHFERNYNDWKSWLEKTGDPFATDTSPPVTISLEP